MMGSMVAHAGLIALATLVTQAPPPGRAVIQDTTIFYVADPRPEPPAVPGRPAVPGMPWLPPPTVLQLPTTLPPPDLPGSPDLPWTADPWPGAPGLPADTGTGVPGWSATPVDARVVEAPPVLVNHPTPRYPEALRQAGIEGEVLVEAVLDTLGRVEDASARVIRGTHALMDTEALTVVRASQYRPGRMGARAVRVRILVPVRFALRR
jgi:protein TonB